MINYLKELIYKNENGENSPAHYSDSSKRVQIATCALFIEVANSDDEFSDDEKELIFDLMKNQYHLSEEEMHELVDLSHEQIEESVSLYEFTDIINKNFDSTEKYSVLKNLWKLILLDGKLDKHEEYFVRKISNNLHLEHRDLIAA
ncbi:MAG: TerB family tellurite resistance protein, partial [Candidatus Heimdallarchaeota archaeon]|nr:TerB family tellurite resistance protein [Candidatus Heimdallarchaeota archaeon]